MIPTAIGRPEKSRGKSAIFFNTNPNIILIKYQMIIDLQSRLEDCQQKTDFKMETLNFHTIFAHTSGTMTKHYNH